MNEETIAQKITSLQRSVSQARKAFTQAGEHFKTEYLLQDAAVVNITRACETAIDLANMVIRRKRLGIPSESKESFSILVRENLIDPQLGQQLQKMVGFRNLAVHQYGDLDMDIVQAVIQKGLDELLTFAQRVRPLLIGD